MNDKKAANTLAMPKKPIVESIIHILEKIIRFFSIILIGSIAALVILQVILRFVFNSPFSWAEELIRYMIVASVMITLGPASDLGNLMGVDFVVNKLPLKIRKIEIAIVKAICVVFYLIISYYGVQLALNIMRRGQLSPAIQLPMWIPYITVPIGLAILAVYEIYGIYKLVRGEGEKI